MNNFFFFFLICVTVHLNYPSLRRSKLCFYDWFLACISILNVSIYTAVEISVCHQQKWKCKQEKADQNACCLGV